MRRLSLGLIALLLAAVPAAADEELEREARRIEGKLMAPCCMTNTVAVHESGIAYEMRREIREMLAAGRSEQQILDHYVDRYGTQILAMPPAEGFFLTPYLSPLALLALASVVLVFALRRWRAADRGHAPPAGLPAPTGPWAERLQRELDRFDEP